MSLLEIIAKISFCLLIAALLGFIVGWLFAKLRKEEKIRQQYNALYENYEVKTSELKQLQEELALKEETIEELEGKFQACEKERLSAQMEESNCDKYKHQIEELRAENNMLISQIKEQKLCEDENTLLKDEIKVLEEERDQLLSRIDECKTCQENYKALIAQVEQLKSENQKLQQAKQQHDTERIFLPERPETERPSETESEKLKKIRQDLLYLKNDVEKIREEKRALKTKIKKLEKRLAQKKKALRQCLSQQSHQATQEQPKTDRQKPAHPRNIVNEEDEIQILTQLIRETLDDIKEQ